MTPYENQLIGSFLFALGYEGGRRHAGIMPANLFQQTPLDRAFSDLVVGSDLCLALEFKRSVSEVSSERRKWSRDAFNSLRQNELLLATSQQAHVIVYGQQTIGGVDLRRCLYSDALRIGKVVLDRGPAQELISSLYGDLTEPNLHLGVSPDQLMLYLREIALLKGASEEGGTGRSVWLAAIRKNDRFFYLVAESLEQLLEPRPEDTRDLDLERDPEQERSLDRESPRRGPSR